MAASDLLPVIDLFAGPGGLGEGFSALRINGRPVFRVALSIEKDPCAHATLMLRSFFRQFSDGRVPEAYYQRLRGELTSEGLYARFPAEAERAARGAWLAELGSSSLAPQAVRDRIRSAIGPAEAWVLVGGPPCQAYSIAGRSRNHGVRGYRLEDDRRHRLYEEYLRIVADLWPPVFVMENVKGLLSTTIRNERLFERMYEDLRDPARSVRRQKRHRYHIFSLEESADPGLFNQSLRSFVVRAECHGIPQRRHRVILLAVRDDLGDIRPAALTRRASVPAGLVLAGLPPLRSGLSRMPGRPARDADGREAWLQVFRRELTRRWVDGNQRIRNRDAVRALIVSTIERLRVPPADRGAEFVPGQVTVNYEREWFLDERLGGACNHATREHIKPDLHRYPFAGCFGGVNRWSAPARMPGRFYGFTTAETSRR
jgi:DNA (cytosine-5)-methyltransferase 1